MSNLIDTPRDRGNFEELARRADKIERLTAALSTSELHRETYLGAKDRLEFEVEVQAKRIKELEADVKYWKGNSEELSKYNARLDETNERLRAVCEMALKDQQGWPNRMREALKGVEIDA